MIVTVTGIRDLLPGSEETVRRTMRQVIQMAGDTLEEIRFGGASGVDTIALDEAIQHFRFEAVDILSVYTPAFLAHQPSSSRDVVRRGINLGLVRLVENAGPSPLVRNDHMLDGMPGEARAAFVVGFHDGRTEGGTAYTLRAAMLRGIPALVVPVTGSKSRRETYVVRK